MDDSRIESAVGQAFGSAEVQSLVKALGITQVPKAKRDDPDAYLAAKSQGVELMFVDRDYLDRTAVVRYGNAEMVYVGATLYSGRQTDDPSFRRYAGALPGGVTFDDPVDQLVARLGPPTDVADEDGVVYTRVWRRGECQIGFNYDSAGVLQYVQINWSVYMDRIDDLDD